MGRRRRALLSHRFHSPPHYIVLAPRRRRRFKLRDAIISYRCRTALIRRTAGRRHYYRLLRTYEPYSRDRRRCRYAGLSRWYARRLYRRRERCQGNAHARRRIQRLYIDLARFLRVWGVKCRCRFQQTATASRVRFRLRLIWHMRLPPPYFSVCISITLRFSPHVRQSRFRFTLHDW